MLKSLSAKLFAAGSVFFTFFIIFSYIVHKNFFEKIDFDTTVKFQDNMSRRLDDVFSLLSVIGHFEVLLIVLVILLIVKRKVIAGLLTFFLFGMFHIIEIFGKTFVEHLPPPEFMLRTKRLVEFPQFTVREDNSYPSGHSGRTVFLSVLFVVFILQHKRLPLEIKIILISCIFLFDLSMIISRIYLGEHWTSDVIGGAILGASFALISAASYAREMKRTQKTKAGSFTEKVPQ